MAFIAVFIVLLPGTALADQARCAERFPDVDWVDSPIDAPITVATAGMTPEMAARFAADVERNANLVQSELGGLDGGVACLAVAELAPAFSAYAAPGQRLHVGVFGEDKMLVLAAVEIRTVDDAIAFGLPHIALWQLAADLGIEGGYPEPLGSTIAHWYMARAAGLMEQYRNELVVAMFLDDPNPELRTADDATEWVVDTKPDPYFFDPQFVASNMGLFIDHAIETEGLAILRDPTQETWAGVENRWRIALREELPQGSFGAEWGVALVVTFLLLTVLLAWGKRRQKKREAQRRPTPPADETLFDSKHA